jgi:hypothetical protein
MKANLSLKHWGRTCRMKQVLKLLFVAILCGLLIWSVSAVASSAGDDDAVGNDITVMPDVGVLSQMSLPSNGVTLAPNKYETTAATITSIYGYVRNSGNNTVTRVKFTTSGGTLYVDSSDIFLFSVNGYYTGTVTSPYAMMDWYVPGGIYPLPGVGRIDAATVLTKTSTSYNMKSPAYWMARDHAGGYNFYIEFWANGLLKYFIPIHVVVT